MLRLIIELLHMENFYGVSEEVEIAKGKYKIPQTIGEGVNQIHRQWRSRKQ